MQATRVLMMGHNKKGRGMISTKHGQRRILKYPTSDLISYMQKAVKSGIYRSHDEIEAMNNELKGNPTDLRRIRWHVPRGSKIQDYPEEYEILSLNPPEPFKPKITVKEKRKQYSQYLQQNRPMDRLAQSYLNNQMKKKAQSSDGGTNEDGEPTSAEEYYRRLLGSNRTPKMDTAMGAKSAKLNKAYAVAVKQYYLMRTENLNERDALSKVEDLLKEEDIDEKTKSRVTAQRMKEKSQSEEKVMMDAEERAKVMYPDAKKAGDKRKDGDDENDDDSSLAALYGENQRAFEGMISWTKRLQAVPYKEWTVGASVALDHWIAKRVLGLSEETWLALLEGDTPSLIGRGRDIVTARHALFPETIFDDEPLLRDEDIEEEEESASAASALDDDNLDAVLATLGGWDFDDDKNKNKSSSSSWDSDDKAPTGDEILDMTTALQDWRAKNMSTPYDDWSDDDKKTFEVST